MSRAVLRRLRRLASSPASRLPRYVMSSVAYAADGSPPSDEEIEAARNAPPMTEEEWEAAYCGPRSGAV